MNKLHLGLRVTTLALVIAALSLVAACSDSDNGPTPTMMPPPTPPPPPPQTAPAPATAPVGQNIFRYDTFGDEVFWTDMLKMNEVIESAVTPLAAAGVGLKIDADALPASVVAGVKDGSIPLDDPQTTLALIKLNAVVGIQGEVNTAPDGSLNLVSVGVTCALCHSTVSSDVHVVAHTKRHGDVDLTGIVGHRLDGWPNRDLNPGAIIALSPTAEQLLVNVAQARAPGTSLSGLTAQAVHTVLMSWGPGRYDARINLFLGTTIQDGPNAGEVRGASTFLVSDADTSPDGTAAPYDPFAVLIPPAYGLQGIEKEVYTGDGDLAHEPVGPLAYWNRYVSVTQMGGIGTFNDPRLNAKGMSRVDHIHDPDYNLHNLPDQVSRKLVELQAYQWSIEAPEPPAGSFDAQAAQSGEMIFERNCSSCHVGPKFTDANTMLHPRSASVARDTSYVLLSATGKWRTSPLRGIWQHPPYFHDGSGNFLPATGKCADGSSIGSLAGADDPVTRDLACAVNLYNQALRLGLTDGERADLVAYLKSL